jgi:protein involved in polysaccharide export with SLBB domain
VTFRPAEVLAGSFDLDLGPRDVIRLVKVGYMAPAADAERFGQAVTVEGPVEFAGSYAWREGMGLRELLVLAKPLLETNQVYAEIVRPLGGGKNEYVTFAPREVASGVYDTTLKARDRVRLYTTIAPKIAFTAQGAAEGRRAPGGLEAGQTMMTPGAAPGAATGQAGATAAAPVAAPTIAPSAPNGAAGPGATAASAGTAPAAGATSIETDTGLYLEVVYTSGSIRYEGPYARTPSLMLSSVVTSDQILQDTNLDYAELTRRKADGSWEYLTFSPREVLGKTYDIPLRAMDSIHFVPVKYLPEKIDFDKFGNAIAIEGATNFPGLYSFSTPQMLSEILTSDQLLSTTDIFYGEIERWQASGRIGYLTFSPLAVLQGYQDIQIYPRDIIRFVTAGDTGENHDFSKYPDTVLLKGSIRYPGRYAWYKGMKLSDILQESDLLIDTETSYAEVRRYSATSDSIINFAPGQVIARKTEVELQPRDTVFFYPRYYQKPISIAGEVADPKVVPYYDQIELSSVLRSVTLSQDLMNLKAEIKKTTGETTVVYLEDYLKRQPNSKVLLSPGDAITIRTLLPDEHLPVIVVRGQVRQPQTIAFSEGMRLSDALVAAGGYDSTAYPKGLVLIRKSVATAQQTQVDRLIAQLEAATLAGTSLPTSTDTTLNSASAVIANMQIELAIQKAKLGNLKQLYKEGFGRISLEIPDSLEALAGSLSDIRLERDDLIYVPKVPTYVLVSGEVSSQNVVLYREGMTVRQAIAESGWMSGEADLSHAYIIRASGKLDSTEGKGFLFFRPNILNYTLQPGDTVFVPTKSAKVSVAWAYMRDTFVSIGSILTSALTAKTLLGL